jgi:hypothetical protein
MVAVLREGGRADRERQHGWDEQSHDAPLEMLGLPMNHTLTLCYR